MTPTAGKPVAELPPMQLVTGGGSTHRHPGKPCSGKRAARRRYADSEAGCSPLRGARGSISGQCSPGRPSNRRRRRGTCVVGDIRHGQLAPPPAGGLRDVHTQHLAALHRHRHTGQGSFRTHVLLRLLRARRRAARLGRLLVQDHRTTGPVLHAPARHDPVAVVDRSIMVGVDDLLGGHAPVIGSTKVLKPGTFTCSAQGFLA